MKKILITLLLALPLTVSAAWWNPSTWFATEPINLGAADKTFLPTALPLADNLYDLGTSTNEWRNIFYQGNLVDSTASDGCASWASGILTSLGVACGSGGGGSSGGTWSTTTSQVSGQFINYPNNDDDIVTIGSNSTTTAEFYFDPNLNAFSIGNAVKPQLSAFGSLYDPLIISNNVNDVVAINMYNRSAGSSAGSCLFLSGDRAPLGGIGALGNYYGGLCLGNSGWNVPGFNALRPNGLALYATDGPLTLGSGSTNAASSSIYFQSGSGLDASYDMTLQGGTGNLGIGTSTPWAKLSVEQTGSVPAFVVGDQASDPSPFIIDANGNIGIGTTTTTTSSINTDGILTVNHAVAANSLYSLRIQEAGVNCGGIQYNLSTDVIKFGDFFSTCGSQAIEFHTADAARMAITAAGLVGVGTTSPNRALEVNGTGFDQIRTQNFTTNQSGGIEIFNNNSSFTKLETMGSTFATTEQQNDSVLFGSNDLILGTNGLRTAVMQLTSAGLVGVGTTTPTQRISSVDNISWGANNEGLLSWSTSLGGSASARATQGRIFRVQADNGNTEFTLAPSNFAGIGTTTPDANLIVNGLGQTTSAMTTSSTLGGTLILQDTGALAGNGGAIMFSVAASGIPKRFAAIKGLGTNSANLGTGDIAFALRQNSADSTLTERVMIKGVGGNVGLSTSSPLARLSVQSAGTGTGLTVDFANLAGTSNLVLMDNGKTGFGTSSDLVGKVNIFGNADSTYGSGFVANERVATNCPIGTSVTGYYFTVCADTGGGSNQGTRFHFNESATGRRIMDWSSSAGVVMSLESTGLLGVGTTSGSYLIDASGTSGNTTLTTNQTKPAIGITNFSTGANNQSPLYFSQANTLGEQVVTSAIIGVHTDHTAASEDGRLSFLTMAAGAARTERMRIETTGGLFLYDLTTAAGTPSSICMNAGTEEITVNAALTCTVSDEDQKSPLIPMGLALETINKIQPSIFSYNDNPDRPRYGFGAQSLQKIDPLLADGYDKDGIARSIDLPALIALNTKAIQELAEDKAEVSTEGKTNGFLLAIVILLALGMGYQQYQIYKLKK